VWDPSGEKLHAASKGITRVDRVPTVFRAARVLFLSGNCLDDRAESISGFGQFAKLHTLSLGCNEITDLRSVAVVVAQLPELRVLSMKDNAVCKMPLFRLHVIDCAPKLRTLNGVEVSAAERALAPTMLEAAEASLRAMTSYRRQADAARSVARRLHLGTVLLSLFHGGFCVTRRGDEPEQLMPISLGELLCAHHAGRFDSARESATMRAAFLFAVQRAWADLAMLKLRRGGGGGAGLGAGAGGAPGTAASKLQQKRQNAAHQLWASAFEAVERAELRALHAALAGATDAVARAQRRRMKLNVRLAAAAGSESEARASTVAGGGGGGGGGASATRWCSATRDSSTTVGGAAARSVESGALADISAAAAAGRAGADMHEHSWRRVRVAEAPRRAPSVRASARRSAHGARAAGEGGGTTARDRPSASSTRRRRAHVTAEAPFAAAPIDRAEKSAAAAAPRTGDSEAAPSPVPSPATGAEADTGAAVEVEVHAPLPATTSQATPVSEAPPLPVRRRVPSVHISRHGSVCIGGESAAERSPSLPPPALAQLHRSEACAASHPGTGGEEAASAGESARRALIVENAMLRHQTSALQRLNLVLRAKVEVFLQHSGRGIELAPAVVPLPLASPGAAAALSAPSRTAFGLATSAAVTVAAVSGNRDARMSALEREAAVATRRTAALSVDVVAAADSRAAAAANAAQVAADARAATLSARVEDLEVRLAGALQMASVAAEMKGEHDKNAALDAAREAVREEVRRSSSAAPAAASEEVARASAPGADAHSWAARSAALQVDLASSQSALRIAERKLAVADENRSAMRAELARVTAEIDALRRGAQPQHRWPPSDAPSTVQVAVNLASTTASSEHAARPVPASSSAAPGRMPPGARDEASAVLEQRLAKSERAAALLRDELRGARRQLAVHAGVNELTRARQQRHGERSVVLKAVRGALSTAAGAARTASDAAREAEKLSATMAATLARVRAEAIAETLAEAVPEAVAEAVAAAVADAVDEARARRAREFPRAEIRAACERELSAIDAIDAALSDVRSQLCAEEIAREKEPSKASKEPSEQASNESLNETARGGGARA
jgi:SWI/SNF-related matrix-associated actin-dependent regulator 1 of chromatin subfamily A